MKHDKVYYIIVSLSGLAFNLMFTAAALYKIDIANLTITQLILTGTALEIAVFVFEIPTGIIADLKSRKLSVIVGLFIIGFGFFVETLTTIFIVIFFAQIIWGFGYTFISGALQSWVSDEDNNENIEHILLTGAQLRRIATIIGFVLAGTIGMYNIRLAIYVASGIFLLLGLFSLIYMKEVNFHKTPHKEPLLKQYFGQLVSSISVVSKSSILRYMFVIMLFYGLYSEGIDRTYEFHVLDNLGFRGILNLPGIWVLANLNIVISILGYLMISIIKKYISSHNHIVLWAMNLTFIMVVGVVLFAYLPVNYLALSGFILFSVAREGTYPLLDTILVKSIPSNVKATVISGFGQLDAIGQLFSGLIMVSVSIAAGVKGVYIVTAIILMVPVILFFRVSRLGIE